MVLLNYGVFDIFLYYNLFNIIHATNLQAEKEMTQFPLSLYRHSAFMLLHIQLSYIRKKIVVCVLGEFALSIRSFLEILQKKLNKSLFSGYGKEAWFSIIQAFLSGTQIYTCISFEPSSGGKYTSMSYSPAREYP